MVSSITSAPDTRNITPGYFNRRSGRYAVSRPRGSDDWLLIVTVEGAGNFKNKGMEKHVTPGDLILYEPGISQDYRTDSNREQPVWSLYWAHFLPRQHWKLWLSAIPEWTQGVHYSTLPPGETWSHFLKAFNETLQYHRSSLVHRDAFAMNAFENALLWLHTIFARDPWPDIDPRIRRVMSLMENTIHVPRSLQSLAETCNLSLSRFSHLFREETGFTPNRYQEQLRMNKACQLLENTSLCIGEIAHEVGYEDPFYFSNRFKKHFHRSPSAYRKTKGGWTVDSSAK